MKRLDILLIEDYEAQIYFIKEIILQKSNLNANVTTVKSIKELKEISNDIIPDIIISDLKLSDSDGEETIANINNIYPGIPIIIISGIKENEKIDTKFIEMGAVDFLSKDELDSGNLIKRIKYALARKENKCSFDTDLHLNILSEELKKLRKNNV